MTSNIDTGCVFGGKLTALRYPEKELVSVPAKQTYAESRKPFLPPEDQAPALSAQQQNDDLLDLADVTGKRIVSTRLHGNVTIREENRYVVCMKQSLVCWRWRASRLIRGCNPGSRMANGEGHHRRH